jgi:hypothetical protein
MTKFPSADTTPIRSRIQSGRSSMTRPTALPFDGNVVAEIRAYHDASLALLGEAIEALLAGNQTAAEELLSQIDIGAIRREAGWLHLVGHGGDSPVGLALPARQRLSLSDQLKRNVAARDGFCCQFTGLRLVDPEVFQIVGALTESFPWHPNYAKRDTPGGRAGHPMTRTHGFGFEHAYPHAFGGDTNEENIILTSMELNEPKGVRVPPRVVAGHRGWDGFRSVLPRLRLHQATHPEVIHVASATHSAHPGVLATSPGIAGAAPRVTTESSGVMDLRVGALYSMRIGAHKRARRWRVESVSGETVTLLEMCWTSPGYWLPQQTRVRESVHVLRMNAIRLLADPAPDAGSRDPIRT